MAGPVVLKWPLLVNITEEDWWAPYDSSTGKDSVMDWAFDNAWTDLENLDRHTAPDLIWDLVEAFIPKSKAKKITQEDIDRVARAFLQDHRDFDSIQQAFIDASTWAWEAAFTPEDRDLESALESAKAAIYDDALPDYWSLLVAEPGKKRGPKDWSPLIQYTESQLFDELKEGITYRHQGGQWDRFVEFDLMNGPIVKKMRSILLERSRANGDRSVADLEPDLKGSFVDPVILLMGKRLEQRMQQVDTHMRVEFQDQWKSILKDKSRAKEIEEEILDFLKAHPQDAEDDF